MTVPLRILLASNVLWFGVGCWSFLVLADRCAALVMPRSDRRGAPLASVKGMIRFLGGLNAALLLLCLQMLLREAFAVRAVLGPCLVVLGVAHASQAAVNVAVVADGRSGRSTAWPVRGTMSLILAVDALLAVADLALAAPLLLW